MTSGWRSLPLAVAVGAAGGLAFGALLFSTRDDQVPVTSTRQTSPATRDLDAQNDLDSACREIESLRSQVEADRQRIEDLTAKLERQAVSNPPGTVTSDVDAFRSRLSTYTEWISEPLALDSSTPELEGAKGATDRGLVQNLAERLPDADFQRFIVSLARERVLQVERAIGRPLTDTQRAGIEQAYERNWGAFREWRGTKHLEQVRAAETREGLRRLRREYQQKKVAVLGRILHEVSDLFRQTEADRAVRDRVLQHF
jgi:hypothetical protein